MAERKEMLDVDVGEFRDFVESFISKMGFDLKDMKEYPDGSISVHAKTTNPMGGEVLSIVRATPQTKEVDSKQVKKLEDEMKETGAVRAALITISDFTGEAIDYARGKPISLINRFQIVESIESRQGELEESIRDFMVKSGLTEKRFMGEDHIFIPSKKREEVLEYFRSKKKKPRLIIGGIQEKIEEVETKYAPVGMFKVTVSSDVHLEGEAFGKVEHDDFLFVNLNNADLYYLRKRRKTGSTDYSVESSPILKDILDLPEEAREQLTDLLEHGELPFKHLDDKFLAILEAKGVIKKYERKGFFPHNNTIRDTVNILVFVVQEVFDLVTLFVHDVMGTSAGDIKRNLPHLEAPDEDTAVVASINMPHLYGGIYDLKKFLVIKMVSGLKLKVDKIKYSSGSISSLLKSIFTAVSVSPRGVLFMPYFICTYRSMDVRGLRRREVLITPKFIAVEMREKDRQRKSVVGEQDALKFDSVPYKIIK
ncbi:MAG: restriction endonuclease [Candidatus Altiarchaeota archaeon]